MCKLDTASALEGRAPVKFFCLSLSPSLPPLFLCRQVTSALERVPIESIFEIDSRAPSGKTNNPNELRLRRARPHYVCPVIHHTLATHNSRHPATCPSWKKDTLTRALFCAGEPAPDLIDLPRSFDFCLAGVRKCAPVWTSGREHCRSSPSLSLSLPQPPEEDRNGRVRLMTVPNVATEVPISSSFMYKQVAVLLPPGRDGPAARALTRRHTRALSELAPLSNWRSAAQVSDGHFEAFGLALSLASALKYPNDKESGEDRPVCALDSLRAGQDGERPSGIRIRIRIKIIIIIRRQEGEARLCRKVYELTGLYIRARPSVARLHL